MLSLATLPLSWFTTAVVSLILLTLLVTSILNKLKNKNLFPSEGKSAPEHSKKALIIPDLFEAWPYPLTRNRHFEAIVGYNERLIASTSDLSPRQRKSLKA